MLDYLGDILIENTQLLAVNEFFISLIDRGFVPEEDIAWVGVPYEFLIHLGVTKICPVRKCGYCVVQGVEFRECKRNNSADIKLEGWFAWNITARTKKLFKVSQDQAS